MAPSNLLTYHSAEPNLPIMLERDMEIAVASCPELFIEPGLSLVRRQVVINGRRPDVLFTDHLSRHLLVEIQRGRLDEDHLQRHFYYYFDYRAKHPAAHLRLMFIANRLVPQHKEFLDEHGYEFREYPANEFLRRVQECCARHHTASSVEFEIAESSDSLPSGFHEILFDVETQKMTLCYKMLLLMLMTDLANEDGSSALRVIAEKFQEFFVSRAVERKFEENPNLVTPGTLSTRSLSAWERVIRDQPVRYLSERFVVNDGTSIRWAPSIWALWNPDLRRELRNAAFDRLVRYFNRNVPGGY
jgi:Endonuclease NucS